MTRRHLLQALLIAALVTIISCHQRSRRPENQLDQDSPDTNTTTDDGRSRNTTFVHYLGGRRHLHRGDRRPFNSSREGQDGEEGNNDTRPGFDHRRHNHGPCRGHRHNQTEDRTDEVETGENELENQGGPIRTQVDSSSRGQDVERRRGGHHRRHSHRNCGNNDDRNTDGEGSDDRNQTVTGDEQGRRRGYQSRPRHGPCGRRDGGNAGVEPGLRDDQNQTVSETEPVEPDNSDDGSQDNQEP